MAADLKPPAGLAPRLLLPPIADLEGRYLTVDKEAGKPVSSREVSAQPVLLPESGTLFHAYSLSGQPELVEPLRAARKVWLCATTEVVSGKGATATKTAKTECLEKISVATVHVARSEKDSSWVGLLLPASAREIWLRLLAAEGRFLLLDLEGKP